MSIAAYQAIIDGELAKFIEHSNQIGGDVAELAVLVKNTFDAQLEHITIATQVTKPNEGQQMDYFKPTSRLIMEIQDFREKKRASKYFHHVSAVSDSMPALSWVCVLPKPAQCVKEMDDCGKFYIVRIVNEWKEIDATHVVWARAWMSTMGKLYAYVNEFHADGLAWKVMSN